MLKSNSALKVDRPPPISLKKADHCGGSDEMVWKWNDQGVNSARWTAGKKNHICLHLSKQHSEEWGRRAEGVSIWHCSPMWQFCKQLWAFATMSASCQDCDCPGRVKVRPKPRLSYPWLLLTGGRERRVVGREGEDTVSNTRPISGAVSSMTAKTVNTATDVTAPSQW